MEPITKDDLKDVLYIMGILLILITGVSAVHRQVNHEKEMEYLKRIDQKIDQREVLDNAYREHLDQCSFMSKDNFYITQSGYVKTNYRDGVRK